MADEKAKIVTDATGPGSGPAPAQPEVDAQVSKQEQSAPEAPTPDKAEAPAQEAPAQDKAADAPKEQKAASVSVFNFSEIMAEKKATERAVAQQEAKAPEKAASPVPSKEAGSKQEEQSQSPKRRGRPPKADKEKTASPGQKEAPSKKGKAAQKPAPAKKPEKALKAPKPAKATPEVKAPVQAETPAAPAEAPRPGKEEQIVYIKLSELHAFKNHPFQVRNDEEMKAMVPPHGAAILIPIWSWPSAIAAWHTRRAFLLFALFFICHCSSTTLSRRNTKTGLICAGICCAALMYLWSAVTRWTRM